VTSIEDSCNTTASKADVQGCIGGCNQRWLNQTLYLNVTGCYLTACKVYGALFAGTLAGLWLALQ
jgi:hypothetical protein